VAVHARADAVIDRTSAAALAGRSSAHRPHAPLTRGLHRRVVSFAGKRMQQVLPTCFAALGELSADHKVRP
jgi:hypothetical protein